MGPLDKPSPPTPSEIFSTLRKEYFIMSRVLQGSLTQQNVLYFTLIAPPKIREKSCCCICTSYIHSLYAALQWI